MKPPTRQELKNALADALIQGVLWRPATVPGPTFSVAYPCEYGDVVTVDARTAAVWRWAVEGE